MMLIKDGERIDLAEMEHGDGTGAREFIDRLLHHPEGGAEAQQHDARPRIAVQNRHGDFVLQPGPFGKQPFAHHVHPGGGVLNEMPLFIMLITVNHHQVR